MKNLKNNKKICLKTNKNIYLMNKYIEATTWMLMGGGSSYIITKSIIETYQNKYTHYDKKINKFLYLSTLFGIGLGLLRYRLGQAILPYYLQ